MGKLTFLNDINFWNSNKIFLILPEFYKFSRHNSIQKLQLMETNPTTQKFMISCPCNRHSVKNEREYFL